MNIIFRAISRVQPVMPGVLIIESMAQTGGLLLLRRFPIARKSLFISWRLIMRVSAGRWFPATN